MTALRLLWYCLWVTPHLLQGIIVYVMLRRKLHRQLPMFFLYSAFEILQFLVLFTISLPFMHFEKGYAPVYSVGLAVSTAIRFGIIYELFVHFFRRYPALDGSGRLLVRGVTIVLLLVAIGLGVTAPEHSNDLLLNATYALDRTVSVLQCGLLISLFLFSRYFALWWRSQAFGIALGLGIFASVELAASAVWLHIGSFGNAAVNLITMATYNCCCVIWIIYLVAEDRTWQHPRKTVPKPPKYDLEIWNQELQRLLQQ